MTNHIYEVNQSLESIRSSLHDDPKADFSIRDKMDIHEGWKAFDAVGGNTLVDCRLYVSRRQGVYGYQFAAAVWVSPSNGVFFSSAGSRTTGWGYCKESKAISSALQGIGYPVEFGGAGTHKEHISRLAQAVAGGRAFHLVHFHA
jgi:hypothetical protein